MKILFVIILILSKLVFGQENSFYTYLENFKSIDVPLIIDRKCFNDLFYSNNKFKEIKSELINLFIYQNSPDEVFDDTKIRYDYGLQIKLNEDFKYCLVHKQNFEGKNVYDFDLSETILFIYDTKGKLISKVNLGKDNDGWMSQISIDSTSIKAKQIKFLEFNKPNMKCEIIDYIYALNCKGIFYLREEGEKYYGLIGWNEYIKDFELLKDTTDN